MYVGFLGTYLLPVERLWTLYTACEECLILWIFSRKGFKLVVKVHDEAAVCCREFCCREWYSIDGADVCFFFFVKTASQILLIIHLDKLEGTPSGHRFCRVVISWSCLPSGSSIFFLTELFGDVVWLWPATKPVKPLWYRNSKMKVAGRKENDGRTTFIGLSIYCWTTVEERWLTVELGRCTTSQPSIIKYAVSDSMPQRYI